MYEVDHTYDYLTWTNLENINFVSRQTAFDSAPDQIQTGVRANRRMKVTREQSPSGGVYTHAEMAWLIPAVLLTFVPKPGDTITEADGTVWTVFTVDAKVYKSYYRCTCLAMRLAHDLRDLIDVFSPTNIQDAGGGRIPQFTTAKYASVAARIQKISEETQDLMGRRGPVSQYQIFTEKQLQITHEDQIRDKTGNVYQVKGYHDPDRLDALFVIDAEQVP